MYTRQRCCLCDDAKAVLTAARTHAEFDYEEIDIDQDPRSCDYTMTKCR